MTNVRLGSISVMFHDLNPSPPRQPQFTLGRYKVQSLCHNGSAGSHRLRYSCKAPGGGMPDRDQAWKLLCEYTQSESLRKHALAVEACVRAYARKNGADEHLWSLTALLHDFDYERWPNDAHSPTEEHPAGGSAILRDRGYPEEMIRAILSHADYSGVPRETPLEHTLFACDELAGFLTACSLVKPGKSIFEVE